jgi:hypothetical protein
MCGLLLKCAALIVMIHGLRELGRRASPRWSGLALGLPSTTALVLVLCGCDQGTGAATEMAESSLLGLVAAVALPLAYVQAVRLGRRLPAALAAAIAGYFVVASSLGCLPPFGALPRLCIAAAAIVAASYWAAWICTPIPAPQQGGSCGALPNRRTMVLRTVIPTFYVLILAVAEHLAGPGWAGLVSTFPSMSLVVLAVTHLEAGPAEASRIAQVLPPGNTSTLAFLVAFRFACPVIGLGWGMISGYAAALLALLAIEGLTRRPDLFVKRGLAARWSRGPGRIAWTTAAQAGLARIRIHAHAGPVPRYLGRRRVHARTGFAPLVETLASG